MELKKILDIFKLILFSCLMLFTFEVLLILQANIFALLGFLKVNISDVTKLVISLIYMPCAYMLVFVIYKKHVFKMSTIKIKRKNNIFLFLICFGIAYSLSGLTAAFFDIFKVIPVSETEKAFQEMIFKYPWFAIISALIIAPIFEEIFFRKYILGHLLTEIKPSVAIFISAILFGVFHMNLRQFIFASLLGIVLGFVYYKSKDIRFSMFLHFAFNLASFFPVLIGLVPLIKLILGILFGIVFIYIFYYEIRKELY